MDLNNKTPLPPTNQESSVMVSRAHRTVAVPFNETLADYIKDAKRVTYGGKDMLLIRHDEANTTIARALGVPVPAPILWHYDWAGGAPFVVQQQTAAMLTLNHRAYVLNDMGTGKTRTVLWAYDYLRKANQVRSALIVAPLSTLTNVWAREIFATVPHYSYSVLHGDTKVRRERLAAKADIYIINHDGIKVVADALKLHPDIDLIVIDELAVFRNGAAARTRTMRKLAESRKRVWGLTGSPIPTEPTDAWAQASIVTPWTVPMSYNGFRDLTMQRITQFKWVPRPTALAHVANALQPSVRFTLDEIVELPEVIHREVPITQSPKQKEVYTALEKELYAKFQCGELTVLNAGVLLNKLLQISLGCVYVNSGAVFHMDNADRIQALIDSIESTDRKVIVYVPFIHAMKNVVDELTKAKISCESVSGETPASKRADIFKRFQTDPSPRVLVAHPQCMAHGITLTAANTIIWFGPIANNEVFEQANARINRIGQTHKQQVLMFAGTTAERKLYARLKERGDTQSLLLDMMAETTQQHV
jgi:SNF2 family DNA or RNA helicase